MFHDSFLGILKTVKFVFNKLLNGELHIVVIAFGVQAKPIALIMICSLDAFEGR